MGKKKNKQLLRPWCWYCEREFEDEKVLMQHQKAKHFKCGMCPRRLNTAGGLAVHIQQVHKLEPENLPRIENALPGRDGYEVEIFGMEGIPAPDVADYKRRKEIELGLAAGSISQPAPKRAKIENRPMSEEELKAQLEAHKALMGINSQDHSSSSHDNSGGAVYGAPPQTYASPPVPPPIMGGPPPGFPPFAPGLPPGPPPPGFMPPGFPPQFPPGMRPPFPPPFLPPTFMPPPGVPGASPPPPPNFVSATLQPPTSSTFTPPPPAPAPPLQVPTNPNHQGLSRPPQLTIPNPALAQTIPDFKKKTELKYADANFSPEEHRALDPKYYFTKPTDASPANPAEETRGKKRARAEDFL